MRTMATRYFIHEFLVCRIAVQRLCNVRLCAIVFFAISCLQNAHFFALGMA